jgi:hypothetical protein
METNERIYMAVDNLSEESFALLQSLVRIPAPSGKETGAKDRA